MQILTPRLSLHDWASDLNAPKRDALERGIAEILTPAVLAPLPAAARRLDRGVAGWIDRQAKLAQGLVIRLRDSGQIAGLVLLYRDGSGTVHLGYLLGEPHWGRGIATEAITALIPHLQRDAPLRLHAGVARDNPASARVLEKSGFTPAADDPDSTTLHFVRVLRSPKAAG